MALAPRRAAQRLDIVTGQVPRHLLAVEIAQQRVHQLDHQDISLKCPFAEYEAMAELMRTSVGRFVVSINDHPEIREVFAGFDLVPLQLDYTSGGGQGRGKKFGELIIKSWDDSQATLL